MKCPICDVRLIESERLGVDCLFCPECDGEWFGRGKVNRLIDRAIGRQHFVTRDVARQVTQGDSERDRPWNWF